MRKLFFSLIAALLIFTLPQAVSAKSAEYVTLVSVDDTNYTAIIVRSNGDAYSIEYGVGVISIWRYEGNSVIISSPGLFAGVGSSIILPDDDQEARIWDSEYIGNIDRKAPSATTGTVAVTKRPILKYQPDNQSDIKVMFQDQSVTLKHKPVIIKNKIMLPVKEMAELFSSGLDDNPFVYDSKTKTFIVYYSVVAAKATIGSKTAYSAYKADWKNGAKFALDLAPKVITGTTYAPLNFFTNGLGAEAHWEQSTKTLKLYIM